MSEFSAQFWLFLNHYRCPSIINVCVCIKKEDLIFNLMGHVWKSVMNWLQKLAEWRHGMIMVILSTWFKSFKITHFVPFIMMQRTIFYRFENKSNQLIPHSIIMSRSKKYRNSPFLFSHWVSIDHVQVGLPAHDENVRNLMSILLGNCQSQKFVKYALRYSMYALHVTNWHWTHIVHPWKESIHHPCNVENYMVGQN